jgi:hypothetical protein
MGTSQAGCFAFLPVDASISPALKHDSLLHGEIV